MGCGQSKINLYPRRNKSGGKGNSSKKSGEGIDLATALSLSPRHIDALFTKVGDRSRFENNLSLYKQQQKMASTSYSDFSSILRSAIEGQEQQDFLDLDNPVPPLIDLGYLTESQSHNLPEGQPTKLPNQQQDSLLPVLEECKDTSTSAGCSTPKSQGRRENQVVTLCEATPQGKALLKACQRANQPGPLETKLRNQLCTYLITQLTPADENVNLPENHRLLQISQDIARLFGTESAALYYCPSIARGKFTPRKNTSGWLVNARNNRKKVLVSLGFLEPPAKRSRSCSTEPGSPAPQSEPADNVGIDLNHLKTGEIELVQSALEQLKGNRGVGVPWSTIQNLWSETIRARLYTCYHETGKVQEYLNTYPVLKGSEGWRLLVNDFESLYPAAADGLATCKELIPNIISYSQNKIKNLKDKFVIATIKKITEQCLLSGAADKEADEEEGTTGGAALPEDTEEEPDQGKHILPLVTHQTVIEVSASQQDFFKMLDERIDKGKDYDSSSETEIRMEAERRKMLIDQWRSASQSTYYSQSQPTPPTPARRRVPRPIPPPSERQNSPGSGRRCYRQQHIPDGMSPPPRRAHSAQSHHSPDSRQINGDNWHDPTKSPVKRPQSAGANWKSNPKVAPYNPKTKKNETNEFRSNHKDADGIQNPDVSQITFNPTFQTHSPAHSAKCQQPYIAQIISYPMSQQVTPPSPPKYIAPPEEYQDPQNNVVVDTNKYPTQKQTPVTPDTQPPNTQSHIYYIHGNATNAAMAQDIAQQRQQTAIHLQQYVAMKQAQQQMFTYLQRSPHTVFPNMYDVQNHPQARMYEGEEYVGQYGSHHPALRPQSAPTPVGVVRPTPVGPGFGTMPDGTHMVQIPMWTHMPPVVPSMGPWVRGQVPPDLQYYPQSPFTQIYQPNSAGSAGTLTRYHKKESNDSEVKNNVCQSINLVRQKPIGQIVSIPGQELTVCNSISESPSPASVSTDSGVSPGNSVPSSKNSVFNTPSNTSESYNLESKNKKNKPIQQARSLKNSKSLDS